jgi:hypothetical protein
MPPQLRLQFDPPLPPPRTPTPSRIPSSPIDYNKAPKIRLREAKQWLLDNPRENSATASRLFRVKYDTLYASLSRRRKHPHGGHNKVLQDYQTRAIHAFIRDLLAYGILPTVPLVFQSIYSLKRASNPSALPPSKAWFAKWWKDNHLHKVKSKPLAALRINAQDESQLRTWFRGYTRTISEREIKRQDIINFDETGFRIGCPKGQTLLVPLDVKEVSPFSIVTIILTLIVLLS